MTNVIEISIAICPECGYDLDRYPRYLMCCNCSAKYHTVMSCRCGCETEVLKSKDGHYIFSAITDGVERIKTPVGSFVNGKYSVSPNVWDYLQTI